MLISTVLVPLSNLTKPSPSLRLSLNSTPLRCAFSDSLFHFLLICVRFCLTGTELPSNGMMFLGGTFSKCWPASLPPLLPPPSKQIFLLWAPTVCWALLWDWEQTGSSLTGSQHFSRDRQPPPGQWVNKYSQIRYDQCYEGSKPGNRVGVYTLPGEPSINGGYKVLCRSQA